MEAGAGLEQQLANIYGGPVALERNVHGGQNSNSFFGQLSDGTRIFIKEGRPSVIQVEYAVRKALGEEMRLLELPSGRMAVCMAYRPIPCQQEMEELSDKEFELFMEGYRRFSERLQTLPADFLDGGVDIVARECEGLPSLVGHSALYRFILRELLALAEQVKAAKGISSRWIHGDLHNQNLGFDDKGELVIYDLEGVVRGPVAYDLVFAIVARLRSPSLSRATRRLLGERLLLLRRRFPELAGEWDASIGLYRIMCARRCVSAKKILLLRVIKAYLHDRRLVKALPANGCA